MLNGHSRACADVTQVFTFGLKPLSTSLPDMSNLTTPEQQQLQQLLRQQQGSHLPAKATGWELQLVMEYCEEVGQTFGQPSDMQSLSAMSCGNPLLDLPSLTRHSCRATGVCNGVGQERLSSSAR